MSPKLEKLKEINETLKNVLIQLETEMFIENILNVNDKPMVEEAPKPNVIVISKQ
jgi:hypothetical protein